jgi:hypothetical protein
MNVNALSNIADPYLQQLINSALASGSTSTNGAATSSINPSSLTLPQDSSAQLSPLAQVLSTLQQLQQSNPTEYQQVTSQIATNLQTAASRATASGNTTQAAQLNQLAPDFTNASQNNTLPNIQDLAAACGGAHHHHHHHVPSSSSDASSSNPANGTSGSSPAGTTSADLSQLISAFLTNSTSNQQNASLDPMSIINNTLTSAGITLS